MQVGIHEAKTNLSRLIPAAQSGEEIIITKSGKPVARLIPFIDAKQGNRQLGLYRGKVVLHDNLLEPLPDEIVDDFWPDRKNNT